jgi:hypothetical protein
MAKQASVAGAFGSDYRLILVRNPPDWSPAQAWAYALGAPYHVQHGVPLNALAQPANGIMQKTTEMLIIKKTAMMLKRDWSIEGDEKLVSTLNWLGAEGHRRPNGMMMRRYSALWRPAIAARREELREAGQEDPAALEELWSLDAVQANTDGIRGGVLIGFDAARAVMLARAGWLVGWLAEPVLWDYILDVARDVQHRFTSWAEYAADYRLSRNVWRASNIRDDFDAITDRLLSDARSPWRRLPWQVPGLEVPRPARPFDSTSPVWTLERWDS